MAESLSASEVACETHPERAAIALCVDCERRLCGACRHVGHDALSRCSACLDLSRRPMRVESPSSADDASRSHPPPESPQIAAGALPFDVRDALEPIPWEQADRYSSGLAMWLTLVAILKNPLLAVARIPWNRQDFVAPLVLCVTSGILGHVGILSTAFIFADVDAVLGPRFAEYGVSPVAGALLSLMTVPLGLVLRLYVTSAMAHFILKAVGATQRNYEATFRIYAYAGTCSLLALLPGVGAPVSMAMTLLVVLLGMRVAHRATPGQSFLGAAPHFLGLLLDSGV